MRLLVRNMSRQIKPPQLQQMFEKFGQVASCTIVKDKDTGRSKGFGFIDMPNAGEAKTAIKQLNGKKINGEAIRVKPAKK